MKNRKEARTWDDAFDREFFTTEEISESDMRASIITAMIEEREAVGNGSCQNGSCAKDRSGNAPNIGVKFCQSSDFA